MRRNGRKSPAEQKRLINAAFDFYGIPQFKSAVRDYKPRKPSGKPLERNILPAIMQALRKHPRVASVQRRQSGVFLSGNRTVRVGSPGEPDISGMLQGGRSFVIEVKVPGREPSATQQAHIDRVKAAGGIAGCAHSVEEALAIIEG